MVVLSRDRFDRAKQFVLSHARPLDKAMFTHEFGDNSTEDVIHELQLFQNSDYGFGHAIEPDIRMNESSVIATTVALQYVTDLQLDDTHELIQQSIRYLTSQVRNQEENSVSIYFPKVGTEVMNSPRAPWWNVSEIEAPELARWPNPNVEVTGYLNRWSSHVEDQSIINQCNEVLAMYLDEFEDTVPFDIYQFLCWKRALPHLPKNHANRVSTMILNQIEEDTLNRENFQHAFPHWVVTEKSSILYKNYPEQIEELFRDELYNQRDNGGWYPTWQWSEGISWDKVELEWSGKLTTEFLITLKYLDMME